MNEIRMMSDVELLAFVLGSKSAAKKLSMVSIAELFGFENGYDADLHSVAEPRAEYNQVAHKKVASHPRNLGALHVQKCDQIFAV